MAEQGSMYSVEQAEDILNRIHSIRKSLIIGKQEKYELMQVGGTVHMLQSSLLSSLASIKIFSESITVY